MKDARFPIVRCVVDATRVRVRCGRRGWHVAGSSADACVALVERLPPVDRDRVARFCATSRAGVVAAHTALDLSGADVALAADRVLLHVHAAHGSDEADRAYWKTACDDAGGLASPQRFAATLPSAIAGDIALAIGLRGPTFVTAGGVVSGASPHRRATFAASAFRSAADVLLDVTIVARADGHFLRACAVSVPLLSAASVAGSLRPVSKHATGRDGVPS